MKGREREEASRSDLIQHKNVLRWNAKCWVNYGTTVKLCTQFGQ